MHLLISVLVSGIPLGILYGLLATAVIVLFRATGVANFAQGNVATFMTFIAYLLIDRLHVGLTLALVLALLAAPAVGVLLYLLVFRINEDAGALNLTTRTLALYLLLFALMNEFWAVGGPFPFPSIVSLQGISIAGVVISYNSFLLIGISLILGVLFACFFRWSPVGLQMLGVAEKPDIARLLGVRTRVIAGAAWAIATAVALIVGVLVAPTVLLSANMMDAYLLYAFCAAIMGGLRSFPGAFASGVLLGLVVNATSVYWGPDMSGLAVFAILVVVLLVRPHGLAGAGLRERI